MSDPTKYNDAQLEAMDAAAISKCSPKHMESVIAGLIETAQARGNRIEELERQLAAAQTAQAPAGQQEPIAILFPDEDSPSGYSTMALDSHDHIVDAVGGFRVYKSPPQQQEKDGERLLINVAYIEGDDPFIYAINGKITIGGLEELETSICNYQKEEDEDVLPCKQSGEYIFKAYYEKEQRDEYGRIECHGYWDFALVSFKPYGDECPDTTAAIEQEKKR